MVDKGGRRKKTGGSKSFQITVSAFAFAYLGYLARTTNMGDGSENGVAASILGRELERMRLSGDYLKDIPPPDLSGDDDIAQEQAPEDGDPS
jgi:hypothetical protein